MELKPYLEDLSDEILLNILDFLPTTTVNYIFFGLNNRFNRLLNNHAAHIQITEERSCFDSLLEYRIILPEQIRSIQMIGAFKHASMRQRFSTYFSSSNGASLTSLRAFKCVNVDPVDVSTIFTLIDSVSSLKHVFLTAEELPETNELVRILLSRSLKSCYISSKVLIPLDGVAPSKSLQHLSLPWCYWSQLLPFISLSVIWLRAQVFSLDFCEQQYITRLKYLHLTLADDFSSILDQLRQLLQSCPDLQNLFIEIGITNNPPLILFDADKVCPVIRSVTSCSNFRRLKCEIGIKTIQWSLNDQRIKKLTAKTPWFNQGLFQNVEINCLNEKLQLYAYNPIGILSEL